MTDSIAARRLAHAPRLMLGTLWQIRCPSCNQLITQFTASGGYGNERLADHSDGNARCALSGHPLNADLPVKEAPDDRP